MLRQTMTPAEAALWDRVRARRLNGLRIRRQFPIGQFVLDFACPPIHLGIELDGSSHDMTVEQDNARTDFLRQYGWTIVRFTNDEVFSDIDAVVIRIAETAASLEAVHWTGSAPRPAPGPILEEGSTTTKERPSPPTPLPILGEGS